MKPDPPLLWSNGSQGELVFAKDLNYNPSLYLRRAFIVYLMAFFRGNPKLGYSVYNENGDADKKHRSLLVTSVYNLTTPDRGKLPAIFVERGPIDPGSISGASRYLSQGRGEHSEIYKTPLATTIICHCLADDDEEADRIANLVRVAIELDQTIGPGCSFFSARHGIGVRPAKIDHVQILRTGPDVYRSSVMAPVMLEVAFDVSRPQGATLEEVEMYLNGEYRATVV